MSLVHPIFSSSGIELVRDQTRRYRARPVLKKQTFVRSRKKRESSCNIKSKLRPISKNKINFVRYQTKTSSNIKLRPIKQKLRPTSKKDLVQYQIKIFVRYQNQKKMSLDDSKKN